MTTQTEKKAKPAPVALVKLDGYKQGFEARFGKGDKVLKFAVTKGLPTDDSQITWHITEATEVAQGVLFVGKDGQTFVADFSRYPEQITSIMVFHGAKQKLGDEYADLDTVDDCLEAARELDSRLAEGHWGTERKGFAGMSLLMRAIVKVYGISEEEARAFLKPLKPDEKAALRASPELKPTIDAMEAEKAKGSNVGELLKKLPGQQPPPEVPAG